MSDKEKVLKKYPRACCVPYFFQQKDKFPSLHYIQTTSERYLPTRIGCGSSVDEAWADAVKRLEKPNV